MKKMEMDSRKTMDILKLWLVIVILILGLPKMSQASHFMGGDMTYECLGGNDYKINLTIYRDCNSSTTYLENLEIVASSQTCNFLLNTEIELAGSYPIVITPLCELEVDVCDSPDGSYGVEEFLFEAIINIPAGCDDVVVGFADCCRNSAISTLNTPNQEGFFIGAIINTQAAVCNNSPEFNNNPTPFSCVGQEVNYNHGVTDDDGDELVFSLVNCSSDYLVGVNYTGGFDGANPLQATDLTIDPATGALSFIPTALQVGVICVRVEEFRNGVKIGEITRDIQFTVLNCATNTIDENILPVLSGIDGTASAAGTTGDFNINVCFDSPLCFDMTAFDLDGHLLELFWNESIENATFNVNGNGTTNVNAEFCWTPTPDDIGLNFFTVTVMDDACDIRGINTYTFTVVVSDGSLNYTYVQDSVTCFRGNDGAATITLLDNFVNPTITWPTIPQQTGLSATNLSEGNYNVTISDVNIECGFAIMQVYVAERDEIIFDTAGTTMDVSCTGEDDGILDVVVNGGGVPPYQYDWSNGEDTSLNVNLIADSYTLTITDDDGCTVTSTYIVNEPFPIVSVFTISDYNGFGISCTGGNDGMINLDVGGGVLPYTYLWSNGATSEDINNITAGTYGVTITDGNGCLDSLEIFLNEPTPLIPQLNNISTTCFESSDGSIVIEDIIGAVPPYSWSTNGTTFSSIDTFPIIIPNQSRGEKEVYFQDDVGCVYMQLIEVGSPDSLEVQIFPSDTFLLLGENIDISFLTNSIDSFDFIWSSTETLPCDTCVTFNYQPLVNTGFNIQIIEKTHGCTAEADAIIRVVEEDFIFVPNIFSPNDDGFNDRLHVYAKLNAIQNIRSFRIFNRWGGLVYQENNFQPNNLDIGWDGNDSGKTAPTGVYVYALEVQYINGKTEIISGDVTLVR